MKNQKNLLLCCFLLLGVISACEPVSLDQKDALFEASYVDGYRVNPFEAKASIFSDVSAEEVEINKGLFTISQVVQTMLRDEAKKQFVIDQAKKSAIDVVQYDALLAQFPELYLIANSIFRNQQEFEFSTVANHTEMKNNLVYQDQPYQFSIRVINLENGNTSLVPIVSPGLETEDLMDEGMEDLIFGWYEKEGETFEILLDEETAHLPGKPLLFVVTLTAPDSPFLNPGFTKENLMGLGDASIDKGANKTDMTDRYDAVAYQMDFRYEGSGRSELRVAASRFRNSQQNVSYMPSACYNSSSYYLQILDVHRNDIGDRLTANRHFSNLWATGDDNVVYNMFERDWYSSGKTLGRFRWLQANGTVITTSWIAGNMKFNHEWYLFNPITNTNTVNWTQINQSSPLRINGTKGYIELAEVETGSGTAGQCRP